MLLDSLVRRDKLIVAFAGGLEQTPASGTHMALIGAVRKGANFAAPLRRTGGSETQTLGPVGVCEMSCNIWPESLSFASLATSACVIMPTSLSSSSTTGIRRS